MGGLGLYDLIPIGLGEAYCLSFFLEHQTEYLYAKTRKSKSMRLILFLKITVFAKAPAEAWQKHIRNSETYQMTKSI